MQTDISVYIADLLFHHDSVSIPGLGSFKKAYKSAAIEYVQGQVVPPTSTIIFNPNLPIDDGLLINYVKKKQNTSLLAAENKVTDYVNDLKNRIEKKEFIVFEGLGRLFKDFEGKLKFLPEGTNFNTDSFGLPKLNFYPIARTEITPSEPLTSSVATEKMSNSIADWFTRNLIWLIIATSILIVMAIYFLIINNQPIAKTPVAETPTERINISPGDSDSDYEIIDDNYDDEDAAIPADSETTFTEEEESSEVPNLAPEQKSAIIIVGKFGKVSNVQKLVKDIYEMGYEPYTHKEGKLTIVGIQMLYENEDKVYSTLEKIRNKFEPDARILKMGKE